MDVKPDHIGGVTWKVMENPGPKIKPSPISHRLKIPLFESKLFKLTHKIFKKIFPFKNSNFSDRDKTLCHLHFREKMVLFN